jgi:uncharacterized membrane protein (DUF4010 family)
MADQLHQVISPDLIKILWVLFLSFLIGLEREAHRHQTGLYGFGGVRTYPLIGLMGYGLALISGGQSIPIAIGLFVIAAFLLLSYWHKLQADPQAGLTSEVVALITYIIGALVYRNHFWEASTLVISSLLLLELKLGLENLVNRFSPQDVFTFTKFLLLTIVILPILPNQGFTTFEINPFKVWLVVIAVSSISYGSFLLQRVVKGKGSILLLALLGGAYSSTVTTVALAKKSVATPSPQRYAGAILMASGMMYFRLALLVSLFNAALGHKLAAPFCVLGLVGIGGGAIWSTRSVQVNTEGDTHHGPTQNPLELKAALLFAALFMVMVIVTHYVITLLGQAGVYTLAGVMGVTDVNPFIMGITQSAGKSTSLVVGSISILIATASNNLVKGFYAVSFGDHKTGKQSLMLLGILAILGLLPILTL